MTTSKESIKDLFPAPSSPPGRLIPRNLPGVNPESVTALQEVLQDNHVRWDMFFNDRGFHNHSAHRAIAIWALGAPGKAIKAGYKFDEDMQRPARVAPVEINDNNWKEHTGQHINYQAFLKFFTDKIREQGVAPVLEQYVFTKDANTPAKEGGHNPGMLDRFIGGLVHPLIHTGYGLEFRLPGMVAEGLAEAATQRDSAFARVASIVLGGPTTTGGLRDTIAQLTSLSVNDASTKKSAHVFDLIVRISKDPELVKIAEKEMDFTYGTVMDTYAPKIGKYVEEWKFDGTSQDIEKKVEELSWMNALLYGVGGWGKADHFNADFFLMHLVTSSIFLPSYCAYLKPESQEVLLRGYLLSSIGWMLGRGLPSLDITGFYETTTSRPTPVEGSGLPKPSEDALLSKEAQDYAITPNPWLPLIETSIVDPNDHLPKLVRALAHYDMLYGARQAGEADFKNTELEGADRLDGTLFLRAAGLTLARLGRVREGQKSKEAWDRDGFYKVK